ncbi:MAG: FAD-binding oxidoreductase, partial [Myxococcales bacterium]|nr:FAD-binding oxidoreductase [Myxococcales bacterium]
EDPLLARLATRSLELVRAADDADEDVVRVLRPTGGLLLGDDAAVDALLAAAATVPDLAADARRLSPAEATALVPALAGADFHAAVHTRECGIADSHALLTRFALHARAGGATLRYREPVTAIHRDGGRVDAVETPSGRVATGLVVNAGGAFASGLAALAGAAAPAMTPMRRHLFVTAPFDGVDRGAPFVWDVSAGWYFRPEGEGLLLCACDQTAWPPEAPPVDPGAKEALAQKLDALVPGLRGARPTRGWSGLRTISRDGRFVIGPDPEVTGFFWVAGLGGHGMTTAAGVGELAAIGILEGALPAPYAAGFAPGRFATSTSSRGSSPSGEPS